MEKKLNNEKNDVCVCGGGMKNSSVSIKMIQPNYSTTHKQHQLQVMLFFQGGGIAESKFKYMYVRNFLQRSYLSIN